MVPSQAQPQVRLLQATLVTQLNVNSQTAIVPVQALQVASNQYVFSTRACVSMITISFSAD